MSKLLFTLLVSTFLLGCFQFEDPVIATKLRFSADTLLFDTVFTQKGSFSKRLWVYNENKQDITIPSISVGGSETSAYRLLINGDYAAIKSDVYLSEGDSLLIVADVLIDPTNENSPFFVEDSIVFHLKNEKKSVHLVSWGQNAHYLTDSVLVCDAYWPADKPYVIYNSVLVDTLCSLTIAPGAQIYSHPGSAIFVKGSLNSIGTANERIQFTNDRFDPPYNQGIGLWEGIYFLEGSRNNHLEYTDIRNGVVGLRIGTPDDDDLWDVELAQVRIENMATYGILAFTSDVRGVNVLINHYGNGAAAHFAGGNYAYEHCTFTGESFIVSRNNPSVIFSDHLVVGSQIILEFPLSASIRNSIIWGYNREEIGSSTSGIFAFDLEVSYSLLKSTSSATYPNNNLFNLNPMFTDPSVFQYYPEPLSPVIDAGISDTVMVDLFGKSRTTFPDLGALEF